jgi:hypothetical protein
MIKILSTNYLTTEALNLFIQLKITNTSNLFLTIKTYRPFYKLKETE